MSRSRTPIVPVALLVLAVLASVWSAQAAGAQVDPYGATTTTTSARVAATCTVDAAAGAPGESVAGAVTGASAGGEVDVSLGGNRVATAIADASGTADFRFTVPALEPGTYPLVAVGGSFNVDCRTPDGGTGFRVLGAGAPASPGGSGSGSGDGSGGGGSGAGLTGGGGSGGSDGGSRSGGLGFAGSDDTAGTGALIDDTPSGALPFGDSDDTDDESASGPDDSSDGGLPIFAIVLAVLFALGLVALAVRRFRGSATTGADA